MTLPSTCPRCGAPLSPSGPLASLCPACLLREEVAAAPDPRRAAPLLPEADLANLRRDFPQLEILRLVGRGGMGLVYEARQPRLDRRVALKILLPELAHDPAFAERFLREARSLAKLSHPNVVAVHDFGQRGERYFLLMEFVDGTPLRELLARGPLDPAIALRLVPEICAGLQYAHERGIVHRDIKPENILVDRQGHAKIADFGLVRLLDEDDAGTDWRLTRASQVMGTPQYMAPEQLHRPREVDHRADIYSLGVVLYEMLTSDLPVGRFALPSERRRLDARLDEVVLRALEREPARRYQRANEMGTRVEDISSHPNGAATTPSTWPAGRRIPFRNNLDSWGGLLVVYGLLGLEGDEVILEYRTTDCFEFKQNDSIELRIPLANVAAVECLSRWFTTECELKLTGRSMSVFGKYPVCHPGTVRFYVKSANREQLDEYVRELRARIERLPRN